MSKFGDETDDYVVYLIHGTDDAWKVASDADGDDTIWLPKSKCEFPPNAKAGQTVTVTVPNWLAEEKSML